MAGTRNYIVIKESDDERFFREFKTDFEKYLTKENLTMEDYNNTIDFLCLFFENLEKYYPYDFRGIEYINFTPKKDTPINWYEDYYLFILAKTFQGLKYPTIKKGLEVYLRRICMNKNGLFHSNDFKKELNVLYLYYKSTFEKNKKDYDINSVEFKILSFLLDDKHKVTT